MNLLKFVVALTLLATAALAQNTVFPQGRLTLQSNTPVMTSDVTGATTVYYTPYQGNLIPIYSGGGSGTWTEYQFSQLTLTISSTYQTAGNIYDVFVFISGGVPVIAFGPQWYSTSSRGTNYGSDIQQLDGIWVNTYGVPQGADFNNGSTLYSTGSVPLYWGATYVGSVYITANGETGVSLKPSAASGGTNNVMGVYNAYNRVRTTAYSRDSTSSWNYSTASWRAADGSTSNRISFLDGLQQSPVTGNYSIMGATSGNGIGEYIAINLDGSTPDIAATMASSGSQPGANQYSVTETFYPQMGLHYIQAVEYASGSGTASFYGVNASQQVMALAVTLDM
jgi:hypothetical protein